ncbi:MAG TPA: ABC transporter permease [Nitrososphaerales archaeon]|nr:ABC transporter permease [Nitrososphaerales archaeon]
MVSILAASLPLTMPILYASVGEVYAEKSGVLNMGIEGVMSLSAFVSLWVTFNTGSYVYGLLAGVAAGAVMGLLHTFVTVRIGVNQLIAGLMIYFLAYSIGDFGYAIVTKKTYLHVSPISPLHVPYLSGLPAVGPILFSQNVLVYLSFAVALVAGLVMYGTTWGLKIMAVGENPEASDAAGVNVNLVRHLCVVLGASLAGLAGASLVLGYLGLYATGDTLVAGRGWIAIVVVIFARWSPYKAIAGAWVFGLGYSIAAEFIGSGLFSSFGTASGYFLLAIPYIFAILFILVFHRGTKSPSSLTVPYKRR